MKIPTDVASKIAPSKRKKGYAYFKKESDKPESYAGEFELRIGTQSISLQFVLKMTRPTTYEAVLYCDHELEITLGKFVVNFQEFDPSLMEISSVICTDSMAACSDTLIQVMHTVTARWMLYRIDEGKHRKKDELAPGQYFIRPMDDSTLTDITARTGKNITDLIRFVWSHLG